MERRCAFCQAGPAARIEQILDCCKDLCGCRRRAICWRTLLFFFYDQLTRFLTQEQARQVAEEVVRPYGPVVMETDYRAYLNGFELNEKDFTADQWKELEDKFRTQICQMFDVLGKNMDGVVGSELISGIRRLKEAIF